MIAIVPNILRESINRKLDEAFKECPEASKDREIFYHQILNYFDEHGSIPDFSLKRKGEGE